jgi:hypothetical protein
MQVDNIGNHYKTNHSYGKFQIPKIQKKTIES